MLNKLLIRIFEAYGGCFQDVESSVQPKLKPVAVSVSVSGVANDWNPKINGWEGVAKANQKQRHFFRDVPIPDQIKIQEAYNISYGISEWL